MEGKAKETFEKWFNNEYPELACEYNGNFNMPITSYNALIIEWLDSVGVYINIENLNYQSWWYFKVKSCPNTYTEVIMTATRTEATNKAIEKAVEIYDTLNK